MNHISTRGCRALEGAVSFCLAQLLLALMPCNDIGRSRVRIPGRFFKVIYDGCSTNGQAIAFILHNAGSEKPLAAYTCSVDDVERETGFDLLDALEDEAESRIESERPDPVAWGLEPAAEGR